MDQREIIPGFDLVFRKDHRVYSVRGKDGQRIPLSVVGFRDGLSLYTAGYFAGALVAMFLLRHVPGVSLLVGWMPWVVAYPLLAGVVAYTLSKVEPDGRKVLRWLSSLIVHHCSPRDRCAGRRIRGAGVTAILSPATAVTADEHSGVLAPCRVHGPATIEFHTPVAVREPKAHRYVARRCPKGAALPVELGEGETLTVLA